MSLSGDNTDVDDDGGLEKYVIHFLQIKQNVLMFNHLTFQARANGSN